MNFHEFGLSYETIDIIARPLSRYIKRIYPTYVEKYPKKGPGYYSNGDWKRISYVFDLFQQEADCTSIVDVGVGCGQLINAIAKSGLYPVVAGLDLKAHSRFIRLMQKFPMHYASITQMPFADGQFDIVSCMEVLEHLEPDDFHQGLKELRRVCGKTLFITVPFEKPEPLPAFHKQRFTAADITRYWPNARCQLLKNGNFSWALLIERK